MLEQLLRESAGLRLLSAQSEVRQAHFEESTSERRRQSGPLSLDLGGQIGAEFEAFGLAPITHEPSAPTAVIAPHPRPNNKV